MINIYKKEKKKFNYNIKLIDIKKKQYWLLIAYRKQW